MPKDNHGMAETESSEGRILSDAGVQGMTARYLASVERLPLNASRPFCLCPVGNIGSGKSTVTRKIAVHFGLARVSGDEIRNLLRNEGYSLERMLDIAYETIRALFGEGRGVAIDSDCASLKVREVLTGLGEEFGYPLVFVHVTAPEDVLLERNQLRDIERRDTRGEGWVSGFNRRKPLHEPQYIAGIGFVYRFDTSRTDISNQITEAISVIESELSKE
jgi:predicted kinase